MMTKWQRFSQSGGFARADNLSLFLDSPTSFGIIIAIILFVIVNDIWRRCLTGLSPTNQGKLLRFVYVNNSPPPNLKSPVSNGTFLSMQLFSDEAVRNNYLNFAQSVGIAGQFLGVGPALAAPKPAELVTKFLQPSKSAGIRSSFMCAEIDSKEALEKGWVDKNSKDVKKLLETFNVSAANSSIQKTLDLIESLDYSLWPESIQTNIENFDGGQDVSAYFKLHLDTKVKVATINAKHGANLRLAASVGWWWNEDTAPMVTIGGKQHRYGNALLAAGIDCAPQLYANFLQTWYNQKFSPWVAAAQGTAAQVFPAIWINDSFNSTVDGSGWIPSKAPDGRQASAYPGVVPSNKVEAKVVELAQLSAKSGIDVSGQVILRTEFGGLAIFDAAGYHSFTLSPP